MNTVVVARHQEDISWLEQVDWDHLVVQKDVDMPNVGREPASFFWAMEKLYGTEGTIAFLQGNPAPHIGTELPLIGVKDFTWLGNWRLISQADGSPHHPGLPVKEKMVEWCQQEWSEGGVYFAAGGQFLLPAERLKKWPKSKYRTMQEAMSVGEHPWVMERLWGQFFA